MISDACSLRTGNCEGKHRIMKLQERVLVIDEQISELRDRKKIILYEIAHLLKEEKEK